MAVIPSGNKSDPFAAALEWAKSQQQQQNYQDLNNSRRDLADRKMEFEREKMKLAPQLEYEKARGRGAAAIETGLHAQELGLDNGKGGATGKAAVNKVSSDFQRGLTDGGLTNPYGLSVAMANAQVESGGWNPNALGDTTLGPGEEAHHLMQWRKDRFVRLRQFAAQNNDNPNNPSPYIQGKFAAWEMNNTHKGQGGSTLMTAKSFNEAQSGMQNYLRMKDWDKGSGAHGFAARTASINDWHKRITGSKGDAGEADDGWIKDHTGEYQIKYISPNRVAGYKTIPELEDKLEPDPYLPWKKDVMPYRLYRTKTIEGPHPKRMSSMNDPIDPPKVPPTVPNIQSDQPTEDVATTATVTPPSQVVMQATAQAPAEAPSSSGESDEDY